MVDRMLPQLVIDPDAGVRVGRDYDHVGNPVDASAPPALTPEYLSMYSEWNRVARVRSIIKIYNNNFHDATIESARFGWRPVTKLFDRLDTPPHATYLSSPVGQTIFSETGIVFLIYSPNGGLAQAYAFERYQIMHTGNDSVMVGHALAPMVYSHPFAGDIEFSRQLFEPVDSTIIIHDNTDE